MAYAQLDNGFHDHPKVVELLDHPSGLAAIGLWTLCLSWASDPARPDRSGKIPAVIARRLSAGDHAVAAELLVKVGLWDLIGDNLYAIHGFAERPEIAQWQARRDAASKAAQARWSKRDETPGEALFPLDEDAPRMPPHADRNADRNANRDIDITETKTETTAGARKRATRLPDDWQPTRELVQWARTECPDVDSKRETENFRDYWHAKAGRDATKLRWDLTWRTWMRKTQERAPRRHDDDTQPQQRAWERA